MFFRYSFGLFLRPRLTFRALLGDHRRVGFGILGILALAIIYFISISIALEMNAMHLPQLLVLNIPPDQYYAYERFFIFPVGLAGTVLASGAIRLGARAWEGKGQFEDLFALLSFSLVEVAIVIGIPDLFLGILIGFGKVNSRGFAYIGPHVWLGTIWYLFLLIIAVKETERLGVAKSLTLGLMGFIVNGVVQFIFIR